MGGAVLFRQRIALGRQPAAVSAAAARKGTLAAPAAAIRSRLPLPPRRRGTGGRVRLLRREVRSRGGETVALSWNRLDRSPDICACESTSGANKSLRACRLERGSAALSSRRVGRG